MSQIKRLLGTSNITNSFAITVLKDVRKVLDTEVGDIIGFYKTKNGNIILTGPTTELTSDLQLLGSSTISASKSVTLPKKVRQVLAIDKGNKIAYLKELEARVGIEVI